MYEIAVIKMIEHGKEPYVNDNIHDDKTNENGNGRNEVVGSFVPAHPIDGTMLLCPSLPRAELSSRRLGPLRPMC